jgi:hypothetical protein
MKTTIKYLLVFGFASAMFLGCATQPAADADQNTKYDYRTEMLRMSDGQTTRRLNELNSQGWVIVSVTPKDGASIYNFRRPKQ